MDDTLNINNKKIMSYIETAQCSSLDKFKSKIQMISERFLNAFIIYKSIFSNDLFLLSYLQVKYNINAVLL